MTDLGCANDWKETPKIVEACIKEKHPRAEVEKHGWTSWSGCYTVRCDECGYRYWYDSSG